MITILDIQTLLHSMLGIKPSIGILHDRMTNFMELHCKIPDVKNERKFSDDNLRFFFIFKFLYYILYFQILFQLFNLE